MAKRKAKELGKDLAIEEPRRSSRKVSTTNVSDLEEKPRQPAKKHVPVPKGETANEVDRDVKSKKSKHPATTNNKNAQPSPSSDRQYWLMKAEPESRLEKGHDIKFSIDDLAAKTVPEPWDGIRAYPARNNIRAMKKGDLAFFYHSSCKVPAIVGTMEIVQEHSPDLSAHDPSAPYYDAKSTPEDPKWSVVHVEFRQKLETPITLRELKDFQGEKGNPLENMQMLKLSRLSVSKVSAEEWEFLTGVMRKNGDEIA